MAILHVTSNGLRIALDPVNTVRTVSIGVWINVGSRHENEENNGIAHLIEHMLFKGTKKRNARSIMQDIEVRGGFLNAFTSREYTCVYGKVLVEDMEVLLDILSDLVYQASLSLAHLQKEKRVVLEEIAMTQDSPEELVQDELMTQMLSQHPLGRNILGTQESIIRLGVKDVKRFHADFYHPSNMVISLAGNVDVTLAISRISAYFDGVDNKKTPTFQPVGQIQIGQTYQLKEIEQTHFCLGRATYNYHDPEYYSLIILNAILGGSASSRLFQEIREKKGLVYSVYSYHQSFRDIGMLNIYAGSSHKYGPQVLQMLLKMLQELGESGVTEEEFKRTKSQIKAQILMGNESVSSKMKRMGIELLTEGRIIEEDEHLKRLAAVTLAQVNDVTSKTCRPKDYALCILGTASHRDVLQKIYQTKGQ